MTPTQKELPMNTDQQWIKPIRAVALSALSAMLLVAPVAFAGPITTREAVQEERIEQGTESGALTNPERAVLTAEQGAIEHKRDKALHDDGHIGPHEAKKLTKAQHKASHHIHHAKHNAPKKEN